MGIQGLLPLLKDIQTPIHISSYSGQTLGVDAYVWLHRGAYGCAREIVLGDPTPRYIAHTLSRIRMLQHFGVKPYLVFDGDKLPAKRGTEADREQRRSDNLAKARALEQQGHMQQAREMYSKCVDVTPEMAYQLIKVLKQQDIAYVVAPYEADAQLAFLEAQGIIDGVVTEDSDLLVFGCKTVLFKLDQAGNAIEMRQHRFWSNRQLALSGWTAVEFRQMAILSGCDYLPSIVGMGLKNAHRLLRRYKTVDKVLQAVRLEGKMRVPPTYAREFRKAELTFVHQRVFDPRSRKLVTLTPLPDGTHDDMLPFIGAGMDEETARGVAEGSIDPISRTPIVDRVRNPLGGRSSSASNIESGSSAAQNRLQRSTTAPTAGSSSSTGGVGGVGGFYRSTVGQSSTTGFVARKKMVSKETGLQSLNNFFGRASSSSSQDKVKAEPSTAKIEPGRVPLGTRDTNRSSNPFLERDSQQQDSKPTQSKFFARASQSGLKPKPATLSQETARDHAYLHLGGELTPTKPKREANDDSGYWDDKCADMHDFVKSSSPPQSVVMDTQELWQGTPVEMVASSAAVVSTDSSSSVVVVPQTPSRGTKRTGMHSARRAECSSPESGMGSGFISSPASSSVRGGGEGGGAAYGDEEEEEEELLANMVAVDDDHDLPSASPRRVMAGLGHGEHATTPSGRRGSAEKAEMLQTSASMSKLEAFRYLGTGAGGAKRAPLSVSDKGCLSSPTTVKLAAAQSCHTTPAACRPPKMLKRTPTLVLSKGGDPEISYNNNNNNNNNTSHDTSPPASRKAEGLFDRFKFIQPKQDTTRSRQLPF